MRTRRRIITALILALTAPLAIGAGALAQSTDFDRIRAASDNAPPVPPPPAPPAPQALPPKPIEGVGAAEALNADINARNAEAAARDRAADEEYARKQREYEARKKADAAAYAKALADYEARKAAVERQRQADLAAWQAQVAACKAGDKTACAPK
ncbi:MAG: hypothetical protein ACOYM5_07780 [Caulobacter sp.]